MRELLHQIRAGGTSMTKLPPQRPPALDYISPDARERESDASHDLEENKNRQRIIDNEANK